MCWYETVILQLTLHMTYIPQQLVWHLTAVYIENRHTMIALNKICHLTSIEQFITQLKRGNSKIKCCIDMLAQGQDNPCWGSGILPAQGQDDRCKGSGIVETVLIITTLISPRMLRKSDGSRDRYDNININKYFCN